MTIRLISGIAGSRQPDRTRRLRRFVQMTLASRDQRTVQIWTKFDCHRHFTEPMRRMIAHA